MNSSANTATATAARGTTVLELDAIQSTVLRGYRAAASSHLFVHLGEADAARAWLDELTGHVTTAETWDDKPDSTLHIAFTAAGLRALGLSDRIVGTFPAPFVQGMASRAGLLGDWGDSAPTHWLGGLGTAQIHAMLWVSALTRKHLDERVRWLLGTLPTGGGTLVSRQDTAALPGRVEHFGYQDGLSQPDIEGLQDAPRTALGAREDSDRWRPVRAGEFVLGYPDEEGVLPNAPLPEILGRNGSYLAYRRLRQDVAAFRSLVARAAQGYGQSEELLGAKLLGRWPDGTPLALSPDRPDPAIASDHDRNNDFSYADDPDGYRCPIGAHIRRANPRASLPFEGKLVNRHRLVRRGLPYGPPLAPGAPDDGVDRGLAFVCFQADLERQFEFLQSQWLNDGNELGVGDDKDVIIGDHRGRGKMTVNGAPPFFVSPLERTVTVTGGEYFFVPGINGLRYLAGYAG